MGATFLKPRWAAWENTCLQHAFAQKIHHRIMAMGLGRSVPSVNKKIQTLGLRLPSSQPGRRKGDKHILSRNEKIPLDLQKMTDILQSYAPLEFFKKAERALKRMLLMPPESVHQHVQKTPLVPLQSSACGFTFVDPMDFFLINDSVPSRTGEKRHSREPAYVSLQYVERWASAKGFHKLRGRLEETGFSYWRNGAYFSKAQLLMHVNRLRYDNELQPLALLEED